MSCRTDFVCPPGPTTTDGLVIPVPKNAIMPPMIPQPDKMMRANKDKPRLSYVLEFPNAMKLIAAKMEAGAKKYERGNWQKGAPVTELVDSLTRHLTDFMAGIDKDAEDGTHTLAGVLTNACMLVETVIHHPEFDDRFARPSNPPSE